MPVPFRATTMLWASIILPMTPPELLAWAPLEQGGARLERENKADDDGAFFTTTRLGNAAGLLLMLSAAACATPPAPLIAAPPPGQARIWFYRLWDPSESLNVAHIDVNGVYFGSVAPGGALYRDVNPGLCHIVPQNQYLDYNQNTNVAVVPGEQVFIAVLDLTSWANAVSGSQWYVHHDTWYARLIRLLCRAPARSRPWRSATERRLIKGDAIRNVINAIECWFAPDSPPEEDIQTPRPA